MEQHKEHSEMQKNGNHYQKLLLMVLLSFISMYILMYAMVDVFGNVIHNINQVYMAGLMTAPMVVFELLLMGAMYTDKRKNTLIIGASIIVGILLFSFIRQQTAVSDRQFLRSMIPHHAGAILMCEQSNLSDAEIQALCQSIIESQQSEIEQMKALLERLEQ